MRRGGSDHVMCLQRLKVTFGQAEHFTVNCLVVLSEIGCALGYIGLCVEKLDGVAGNGHVADNGVMHMDEHFARACAALVISPGGLDLASLTETPAAVPVILLNRTLPYYSSVSVDQLESGRMAAKHAMKKGGDDIILVSSKSLFGVMWRGNAFLDCCRSNGVSLDNRIYYADTDITAGYELGKRLIAAGKLAKVIVCAYDMTALGISSALTEAGIAVGREVQIIVMCSSNEKLFEHYTPPITAVDLRFRDACQMAMHLAMDIATGRASYPQDISIRPVMIYRQSCPM